MGPEPLKVGEIGILQHLSRSALNGQIAEVTGELRRRMLYCLTEPAKSEICLAYTVQVPGYPAPKDRIVWCVEAHQIRRLSDPDDRRSVSCTRQVPATAAPEA